MGSVLSNTRRGPVGLGRMLNFAWRCSNVNKERRLGRGLEALLGRPMGAEGEPLTVPINTAVAMAAHQPEPTPAAEPTGGALTVSVHAIDRNPYQPRQEFDDAALAELSASI